MRPRDPVELLVARAWAGVLGRPWISVRDSFATLGGDASARERMLDRVAREVGIGGDLGEAARAETVEALAAALKRTSEVLRQRARAFWARNVQDPPGAAGRPPLFFFHGERGGGLQWFEAMGQLGLDQPVYGIAPQVTSGEPIPETVEAIAAGHLRLVREIQPAGPYLLGGHCNGGVAAFEAARQLLATDERVTGLLLVAPMLPATYRRGVMGLVTSLVIPAVDQAWALGRRIRRRARRAWGSRGEARAPARRPPIDRWSGELFERYSAVLQAYRPSRLAVPATILWPREEPRRFRTPSERAWYRALPAARRVEIPGTHMGCATEHGAVTVREIRRAVDAALDGVPGRA